MDNDAAMDTTLPSSAAQRREKAAAAAAYALIDTALPAGQRAHSVEQAQRPSVPLHVLRAAVTQCTTARNSGSAFSPIALDEDDESDGVETPESFASDDDGWANDEECIVAAAVDGDDDADADAEELVEAIEVPRTAKLKPYASAQFPDGYHPGFVCSMDNLKAAQDWSCPCHDRRNCIGQERIDIFKLYEFRKAFKGAHNNASLRDAMRAELQAHYDEAGGGFTRSFVVAGRGDCCATSAGLARGMSFGTFSSARADVTHGRDWHAERRAKRKARAPSTPPAPPCAPRRC